MDVDALMDLANVAVEDLLGVEVIYTPADGGEAQAFRADFQESYEALSADMTVDVSGRMSALDVRASALDDLDVRPTPQSSVSFAVRGEARTYRVTDVRRTSPGSVVLILGERGA